ncbi:MAG: OprO/OprP family phosphate-selective porin [Vicinamibacteria bacterium]|nr:OprO/OprP family phosphate-selective porin [Vicinamibacteria bacterium]
MLHFVHVLALMAGSVDPAAAGPVSIKETATRVVAEVDGAAATEQAAPPAAAGGYKIVHEDGATTLTLDNAEISLSNRLQFRFTDEIPPDNVRLPGTTSDGQSKPSFRIRRAKTSLEGWFWKKELTYEVQLSWAGPEAGASTQTPLEDALLTWDASKKGAFKITLGQFKVPLGRQEMTSSGHLQFADRSILNGEYTRGRDVGLQISGRVASDKVEYFAGVFNGNSASRTSNDNTKLQYNARVSFEPLGKVAYSETGFEGWDKPLLAIAGQFENNDLSGATNLTDLNTTILGADLMYKYKGFSLFAEYYNRKRKPEAVSGTSSNTSGPAAQSSGTFHSNGYNVEAGFFLKRDKVEIAARYAEYDPSDKVPSNRRNEKGGVLNYFILKHTLKVVADFRALRDDLVKETTKELRIQTQFIF